MSLEKVDSLMTGALMPLLETPFLPPQHGFALLSPSNVDLVPRYLNVHHEIPAGRAEPYTLNYVVVPGTTADDMRDWMEHYIRERGCVGPGNQFHRPPGSQHISENDVNRAADRGFNVVREHRYMGGPVATTTSIIEAPERIIWLNDLIEFHQVFTFVLAVCLLSDGYRNHSVTADLHRHKLHELRQHVQCGPFSRLDFSITTSRVQIESNHIANSWSLGYNPERLELQFGGQGLELLKAHDQIYWGV